MPTAPPASDVKDPGCSHSRVRAGERSREPRMLRRKRARSDGVEYRPAVLFG